MSLQLGREPGRRFAFQQRLTSASRAAVALVLPALLFGCASGARLEQLEGQVADLQAQSLALHDRLVVQEDLDRLGGQLGARFDEQAGELGRIDEALATLARELQNVASAVHSTAESDEVLRELLGQLGSELDDMRAELAGHLESEATYVVDPSTDPDEVYQRAYNDYLARRYTSAIGGFRQYLANFGDTTQADNAQYWIGESFFGQRQWREAVQAFDLVSELYPESERIPSARLRKAYALIEMGNRTDGAEELRRVRREYPNSDEAILADKRLDLLGLDGGTPPR